MGTKLEEQVMKELKPGERLLWQGQPASRRGKQRKTLAPFKSLLVVGGILVLISGAAIAGGNPGTAVCMAVIFAVMGVFTIRERYSAPYRLARTMYALTNRRVFIIRDYPPRRWLQAIPLQFISDAAIVQKHPDGRGTIRLGSHNLGSGSKQPEPLRFLMVEGAQSIHDLILQTRQSWLDDLSRGDR